MVPRTFIKRVLVDEIGDIVPHHPYLAFPLIAIGLEFLGRAVDVGRPWNHTCLGGGQRPFDEAIGRLFPQSYHDKDLRRSMRNKMLHIYRPQPGLALGRFTDPGVARRIPASSHPYRDVSGNVTLVVEYLFDDFAAACDQVIRMRFPRTDKMNRRFIRTDIPVRR
jgi:hypothetical protein